MKTSTAKHSPATSPRNVFFCHLAEPPKFKDWAKTQILIDAVNGKRDFVPKNPCAVSEVHINLEMGKNPKGLFLTFYELTTLLSLNNYWQKISDVEITSNFVEFRPQKASLKQMHAAVVQLLKTRRMMYECLRKLIEFDALKKTSFVSEYANLDPTVSKEEIEVKFDKKRKLL